MNIELRYCSVWNYEPKAVSLASKLLTSLKQKIKDFTLIPSGGGCFEVKINGELIYSKLQSGQFPDEKWVLDVVSSRLKKS